EVNPTQILGSATDLMLTALGVADQTVSPAVQAAITPIMCSSNPTPCQIPSLLGEQINDLRDLLVPPAGQPPPDGNALMAQAVASGKPMLVATLGTVHNPRTLLPKNALNINLWDALFNNPAANALLAPLGLVASSLLVA